MRLLLADDHALLRDALALFLRQTSDMIVDTTADLSGTLRAMADGPGYDLVLLDYAMPGMEGLEGLERTLAARQGQAVALLSGNMPRDMVNKALEIGAAGVLSKSLSAADLTQAIFEMARGGRLLQPQGEAAQVGLTRGLTPRERQVLQCFHQGLSNREISEQLQISEPTVKLHAKTLFRKIGAANRTQAAMIARNMGIEEVDLI